MEVKDLSSENCKTLTKETEDDTEMESNPMFKDWKN